MEEKHALVADDALSKNVAEVIAADRNQRLLVPGARWLAAVLAVAIGGWLVLWNAASAEAARWRPVSGQWVWGQSDIDTPPNSTRCHALSGGSTVAGATGTGQRNVPWIAGSFSALSLRIHVDGEHDIGGPSYYGTGTLYVNGVASALSARIQGTSGTHDREAPADFDSVTVEDGDLVEFCVTTGPNVPAATDQYHWSIHFDPETPNQYVYATVALFSGSSSQHVEALGTNVATGGLPEVATQFLVPVAGTMTRMLCAQAGAQTTGSRTWTLRRRGTDSAQACAFTSGATASSEADVAIAAGDLLGLRMEASSPEPSNSVVGITWVWEPDSPGEWFLASSGNTGWSSTEERYQKLLGPQPANSTRYTANAMPFASNAPAAPYVTVTSLHAAVDLAPGAGRWIVDLVEYPTQNSSGAPLTSRGACSIVGAAKGCSVTFLETARAGPLGPSWYELRVTPNGAPGSVYAKPAVTLRTVRNAAQP